MRTKDNTITLVITFYEGDYEVTLTGTGLLDLEVCLGKFDELHEARAFCEAFEGCTNITTIEDLTSEELAA